MGYAATVVAEYRITLSHTEALIREFRPFLSAGLVINAVTRCRAALLRSGVRRGLAGATDEMARAHLEELCARSSASDRDWSPLSHSALSRPEHVERRWIHSN